MAQNRTPAGTVVTGIRGVIGAVKIFVSHAHHGPLAVARKRSLERTPAPVWGALILSFLALVAAGCGSTKKATGGGPVVPSFSSSAAVTTSTTNVPPPRDIAVMCRTETTGSSTGSISVSTYGMPTGNLLRTIDFEQAGVHVESCNNSNADFQRFAAYDDSNSDTTTVGYVNTSGQYVMVATPIGPPSSAFNAPPPMSLNQVIYGPGTNTLWWITSDDSSTSLQASNSSGEHDMFRFPARSTCGLSLSFNDSTGRPFVACNHPETNDIGYNFYLDGSPVPASDLRYFVDPTAQRQLPSTSLDLHGVCADNANGSAAIVAGDPPTGGLYYQVAPGTNPRLVVPFTNMSSSANSTDTSLTYYGPNTEVVETSNCTLPDKDHAASG